MAMNADFMEDSIELDTVHTVDPGTILIIEDDPRIQKVLRRIFIEEHYAVVVAGYGQTG
ncbi:MAG: hypothetical protein JWQ42_3157 [Edaphobacter sp.]|jgi:hypothetical protein|nr:hypothetical protein [Edaphobacter sp.]